MTYLDSSAILAIAYGERHRLDPRTFREPIISRIGVVECHRSVDRLRFHRSADDGTLLRQRETIGRLLRTVGILDVEMGILERAADAYHVPLRTLGAVHLATALRVRQDLGVEVTLATHDRALAAAARAYGFTVAGA